MRNRNKEKVLQTALQQYESAIHTGSTENLAATLKMMENVRIMCAPYSITGIEKLEQKIREGYDLLKKEKIQKLVITDIAWDAPESASLPSEIVIAINANNAYLLEDIDGYAETLSDYLSDEFGYCHTGFAICCQ